MTETDIVLADYQKETAMITREATDIVANPVVMNGYIKSGKPNVMAYQNLEAMAWSRTKKQFPYADKNDPLFNRVKAELKRICAQIIYKKYREREMGNYKYDHLKDADNQCSQWLRQHLHTVQKEFAKITNQSLIESEPVDLGKTKCKGEDGNNLKQGAITGGGAG